MMHLLIHDYAGHPFQAQLSRALAARGYRVTHVSSNSNPSTPKGNLARLPSDPTTLSFDAITLPRQVQKTSFVDRWRLERLYGRFLRERITAVRPDLVLCANTPLDALTALDRACDRYSIPWVFWLQDLLGKASARILRKKMSMVGSLIGGHYSRLEATLLARSAMVIGITEDFWPEVERAGISRDRYVTIPNWAPLDEIRPRPKVNPWSLRHGIAERFVFLYSGTLGLKHNPSLLLELALALCNDPRAIVIANSSGAGADWLRTEVAHRGLDNLRINGFQPYGEMSDVLGSADVLISILEPEAGHFSVPSKVLSYHCASRAMLLAVPSGNLAAQIVLNRGSGLVADPRDPVAFVDAALALKADDHERTTMATRARAYAEDTFAIDAITDRFEAIFQSCINTSEGGTDVRGTTIGSFHSDPIFAE